jgi:hypothetical protein
MQAAWIRIRGSLLIPMAGPRSEMVHALCCVTKASYTWEHAGTRRHLGASGEGASRGEHRDKSVAKEKVDSSEITKWLTAGLACAKSHLGRFFVETPQMACTGAPVGQKHGGGGGNDFRPPRPGPADAGSTAPGGPATGICFSSNTEYSPRSGELSHLYGWLLLAPPWALADRHSLPVNPRRRGAWDQNTSPRIITRWLRDLSIDVR